MKINGTTFYGNEVSEYGKENGYVDYKTLASAFDAVMANALIETTSRAGFYWEPLTEDGYDAEVFQWFIIDRNGVDILSYWTDEIIYYCEELDLYLWGVTHFGTAWSYVLTDIEIEK